MPMKESMVIKKKNTDKRIKTGAKASENGLEKIQAKRD